MRFQATGNAISPTQIEPQGVVQQHGSDDELALPYVMGSILGDKLDRTTGLSAIIDRQGGSSWYLIVALDDQNNTRVVRIIDDGCGSFMSTSDGSSFDHLTSFSFGRRDGSGLGTTRSA